MLGLYISDHPLMGLEGPLARLTDCTLAELRDLDADAPAAVAPGFGGEGQVRLVGGVVTELVPALHQKGRADGHLRARGPQRLDRGLRLPQGAWPSYGALLDDDAVVVLKGRVDIRDDQLKLVCMEVQRPELAADGVGDLRISLPSTSSPTGWSTG